MLTDQWEGCDVVVETCIAPAFGIMAGRTICPEATPMIVVIRMAGIAICRRPLINSVCVAGITRQAIMSPGQREACIVMVEGCTAPTIGGMTSATIRTELSAVRISGSMTGVTVLRRTFIAICMARTALHIAMSTGQREACIRMIESRPTPAVDGVTSTTIFPKLPIVCITIGMTGITIAGRTYENTVRVAGSTGNILMLSA